MKLSWLFVVLLLVFVAVFSVQNAAPMGVRIFAWEINLSAALVIQFSALLGALVGFSAARFRRSPKETAPVFSPDPPSPTNEGEAPRVAPAPLADYPPPARTTRLRIANKSGSTDHAQVEHALKAIAGVSSVKIDSATNTATVQHTGADVKDLQLAAKRTGYVASVT